MPRPGSICLSIPLFSCRRSQQSYPSSELAQHLAVDAAVLRDGLSLPREQALGGKYEPLQILT
ncbi:MAG TPA: hypothetical protein VFW87_08415 [Pirellulales bacterium]|nr:hypothetical protein [Pirellulales bacterium]